MDNNINYIIEENIDDYLLTEIFGWGKKPVYITGYEPQSKKLYGRLADDYNSKVWINVKINYDKKKVTKVTATDENEETFKVKIKNMPQEGQIMFIAEVQESEGEYFGIDSKFRLYTFSKNQENGQFYTTNEEGEEEPITLSWFPKSLEYNQEEAQNNVTQDGGNYQEGGYQEGGYYPAGGGYGGYPAGGGYGGGYQGGGYQGGGYPAGGYQGDEEDDYYEDEDEEMDNILDLNIPHPLSTAINKLIESRRLRNSKTAYYLIKELYNLGL